MDENEIRIMKENFTNTFVNDRWNSVNGQSKSGLGSSLEYTINLRDNLLRIIDKYNIKTIFDCSCGDWNWMKEIKEKLPTYVGNDIVETLIDKNNSDYKSDKISFVSNDMLSQLKKYDNKSFDLILCRHTLEHLKNNYSIEVITEIKRVSKYAIITTNNRVEINEEISNMDGVLARSINLKLTPFVEVLGDIIEKFYDSKGEPSTQESECSAYLIKNY